jgi:hypothetical protein
MIRSSLLVSHVVFGSDTSWIALLSCALPRRCSDSLALGPPLLVRRPVSRQGRRAGFGIVQVAQLVGILGIDCELGIHFGTRSENSESLAVSGAIVE